MYTIHKDQIMVINISSHYFLVFGAFFLLVLYENRIGCYNLQLLYCPVGT